MVIGRCGKFAPDRPLNDDGGDPAAALVEAARLITTSNLPDQALPFPALERLAAQLRQSRTFAPIERGLAMPLFGRSAPISRAALRTPLWVVDLQLGRLLAAQIGLSPTLPFPDAVTAEALAPQLWPGERALVLADALRHSAERHIAAIRQTHIECRALEQRLRHLRASARAPQVWLALRGFAPMGIEQLTVGFGIGRRGTYAVSKVLEKAGLASRTTVLGRVKLSAMPPGPSAEDVRDSLSPLPSPLLAEFDAIIADVDRLLARQTG